LRKNETSVERLRAASAAASIVPQLAAREAEADRRGTFAADNMQLVRDAGLLTLNIPQSNGGFGERLGGTVDALRTIAQGSPSTALMLAMHTSTLAHYQLDSGDSDQRNWAYDAAMNGRLFAVANSEAGAGGDVRNSRAEVRNGRLFGVKTFASMGTFADYFMAAARDESGTVEYFLVRNEPEHVRVESPWNATGMRSSESVSLRFDGAAVVGPLVARGLLSGINNRHWATLSFTAVFIGTAESLLADIARQHEALNATAAVDLHLVIQASRAFLRHCVEVEPAVPDDAYRKLVRDCKVFATRALAEKATAAFLSLGGSAYRADSPASRKLRDLLAGPAVRPPVASAFEEIWKELSH
jgi:alkylation response protein AidB-like acyl-CoA dehydrogenase